MKIDIKENTTLKKGVLFGLGKAVTLLKEFLTKKKEPSVDEIELNKHKANSDKYFDVL